MVLKIYNCGKLMDSYYLYENVNFFKFFNSINIFDELDKRNNTDSTHVIHKYSIKLNFYYCMDSPSARLFFLSRDSSPLPNPLVSFLNRSKSKGLIRINPKDERQHRNFNLSTK